MFLNALFTLLLNRELQLHVLILCVEFLFSIYRYLFTYIEWKLIVSIAKSIHAWSKYCNFFFCCIFFSFFHSLIYLDLLRILFVYNLHCKFYSFVHVTYFFFLSIWHFRVSLWNTMLFHNNTRLSYHETWSNFALKLRNPKKFFFFI